MRGIRRPTRMTAALAADIAARALLFLAEDPGRLGRFLAVTGLGPETLRQQARNPEMLAAALGHVMEDESTLLTFAANAGIEPELLVPALATLGGTGNWDST
jgi:hypothetical protein